MRVLMLSWEYPPRLHGGLGRHVHALSRAMARAGHDVHVVANSHPDAPPSALVDGVHVHRVPCAPPVLPEDDWVAQVLAFNVGAQAAASKVLGAHDVDVIHAHDWLVAYAAAAVKETSGLPLVATIHATELGRHQGHLPGPMNRYIHQAEWWLTFEARRLIACSAAMAEHVRTVFELPDGKVDRIGNGVDVGEFAAADAGAVQRLRATLAGPEEPLVLFAGRLEYEKGVQDLMQALRRVRRRGTPARLVVAGDGTYRAELEALCRRLRLVRATTFTGFRDRMELVRLYQAADVTVVPSIYEPFGIVALESMAAGTPLIASRTGGLAEVVAPGRGGLVVEPRDVAGLADALERVLTDERLASTLAAAGRVEARRHGWDAIAARTVASYRAAERDHARLAAGDGTSLRLVFDADSAADGGGRA
jgi:glycogen(starch) synthase